MNMQEENKQTANGKPELPAYRVIFADGTSYVTSMARNVDLKQAQAYFVGASIEQEDGSCKGVVAVIAHNAAAVKLTLRYLPADVNPWAKPECKPYDLGYRSEI